MSAIFLDVAYDSNDDFPALMNELEQEYEVEAIVFQWTGPGGGWPVIKFVGERPNLQRLVKEKYDSGDPETNDMLIRSIEE